MVAACGCAKGRRKKGGRSCLCHLPSELLQIILSRLSILDYIFCRVVSKCWRSAFSLASCSSETTSLTSLAHNQSPWFLILSTRRPPETYSKPCCLTTGKFGNLATGHIHTTNMPELCGTFILLSKHGWLLLFDSSSLFFFDMFSRARISLPFFNVRDLWSPVYDISTPPTSPDCVLFIMSLNGAGFEVRLCSRKDPSWTTLRLGFSTSLLHHPPCIEKVTFVKGIWYCLHRTGEFSTFDVANRSFKFLGRPLGLETNFVYWSHVIKCGVGGGGGDDDQVRLRFVAHGQWYEIALMDPIRVVRCSNNRSDVKHLLRTDATRVIKAFPDALAIDSFNADVWCVHQNSNDVMNFRWHCLHRLKDKTEIQQGQAAEQEGWSPLSLNEKCPTNIMWVKPTRVHSFSNLSWKL